MATARLEGARRLPDGRSLGPLRRCGVVAEIAAAYLRARRELRRAPIETAVMRLRADGPPARTPDADQLWEARRLGWMVVRVLTFLPGDTRCLCRSLVLTRILARRGIPARLVIGARTSPGFLAHAWVECGGVPVLSSGGGSFGRLVEL
jgi:Transglutaminase-like superfamily